MSLQINVLLLAGEAEDTYHLVYDSEGKQCSGQKQQEKHTHKTASGKLPIILIRKTEYNY